MILNHNILKLNTFDVFKFFVTSKLLNSFVASTLFVNLFSIPISIFRHAFDYKLLYKLFLLFYLNFSFLRFTFIVSSHLCVYTAPPTFHALLRPCSYLACCPNTLRLSSLYFTIQFISLLPPTNSVFRRHFFYTSTPLIFALATVQILRVLPLYILS